MQLQSIVLYHRDQSRRHELTFTPGELNVVTGISDTGKSAILEIIDYCLGKGTHSVFRGPQLETIRWYGLRLLIKGKPVFVARERPPLGQTSSDRAAILTGLDAAPDPAELRQTTNVDTLIKQLSAMMGIADNAQPPPEGSSRSAVCATIRHAVPYVLQRQRLICDPKFLFAGQDDGKEHHIRDTLPYFLGAVDQDALQQRRELRRRRAETADLRRQLADAIGRNDAVSQRAMLLLADARETGLLDPVVDVAPEEVRTVLKSAMERPLDEDVPATGEAAAIRDLQDSRSDLASQLRDVRLTRRTLADRARLAREYTSKTREHRSRLRSLELLPTEQTDAQPVCPLCGSPDDHTDPGPAELQAELRRVQQQVAESAIAEPQLERALDAADEHIEVLRGRLQQIDRELRIVVQRSELAQRARGRLQQQAYVRGRIAGFLDEHPAIAPAQIRALEDEVAASAARVARLEQVLGADATRAKTENALDYIGDTMTQMAKRLRLSYATDGVRLDPVALTVVGRDPSGPVWLNKDIGSGKNWVGYHVVTLLALQRYFTEHDRPVPQMLVLDQPTQAFFPDSKQQDPRRSLADMADNDQAQVMRIFELLHNTVAAANGKLQVIVTDHARLDTPWFDDAVNGRDWHNGAGLVPRDWYT